MSISHVKNIAVIGATGNLGSLVIKHLIAANQFNITAISRSSSSPSPFLTSSANLTHITGDYNSPTFLSTIFKDIEAVILTLHHSAVPDLEIQFIEAAAASGVKWILPTEFGSDTANEELVSSIPILGQKTAPRKKIEELSEKYEGLKWIGIVNNPWFDFSMKLSMWQINPKDRTARFLSGGAAKFNTTNLNTVALAVARLFTLPISSSGAPSVSTYANKHIYISSFLTSQREILNSVQKATGTTDKDWKIENMDVEEFIEEGRRMIGRGEWIGVANLVYGATMKEGPGSDYETVRGVDNDALGLPKEDLDECVKGLLPALLA